MPHTEILPTLAEVSVAFVGFSALVLAFRGSRSSGGSAESMRIRTIIGTGLAALLFSTLPYALLAFDASLTTTWRVGSGLQAIVHLVGASGGVHAARHRKRGPRPIEVIVLIVGVLVVLLQVLNALAVIFEGAFGPYLLGIMWLLSISAFMLSGLVAREPAA